MRKNLFLSLTLSLAMLVLNGCPANTTSSRPMIKDDGANNSTSVSSNSNSMNAANSDNSMNKDMSNMNSNAASKDDSFMTDAAQGGMAEVGLGQLAASKAQNAKVKKFGQKMVEDHTKANAELKSVAAKKSFTLPPEPNAMQKETKDKLSKMSGAEFDKEYIKVQIADHEKTAALFQKEIDSGTDADAKAFAAKTLPTVKMHLEMIKKIQESMK